MWRSNSSKSVASIEESLPLSIDLTCHDRIGYGLSASIDLVSVATIASFGCSSFANVREKSTFNEGGRSM
jgi:hypothetical protein